MSSYHHFQEGRPADRQGLGRGGNSPPPDLQSYIYVTSYKVPRGGEGRVIECRFRTSPRSLSVPEVTTKVVSTQTWVKGGKTLPSLLWK